MYSHLCVPLVISANAFSQIGLAWMAGKTLSSLVLQPEKLSAFVISLIFALLSGPV